MSNSTKQDRPSSCDKCVKDTKRCSSENDKAWRKPSLKSERLSSIAPTVCKRISCVNGKICTCRKPPIVKPKKTARSEVCMGKRRLSKPLDYCKNCGDVQSSKEMTSTSKSDTEIKSSDFQSVVLSRKNSLSATNSKSVQKSSKSSLKSQRADPISYMEATFGSKNSAMLVKNSVEKPLSSKTSIRSIKSADIKSHAGTFNSKASFRSYKVAGKGLEKGRSSKSSIQSGVKFNDRQTEKVFINGNLEQVQQHYKNENFRQTSDSACYIEKNRKKSASLDPIKELPEKGTTTSTNSMGYHGYSDSESEEDVQLDPNDSAALRNIQQFRTNNYFECHSIKFRLKNKINATSLKDHQCSYRFYLNERLFPIPWHTDHQKIARCVECHLPLNLDRDFKHTGNEVNGTIQAKATLGTNDDVQDVVVMLPVKEPLFIKEKRQEKENDKEVVYFGVIKLAPNGNSLFNQNLPTDSLALRYQKGYKELDNFDGKFDKVEKGDVIVI